MKKLEELLNLPPMPRNEVEEDDSLPAVSQADIAGMLTLDEQVTQSLASISDLNEHDQEMDRIAKEAMSSYQDFKDFGMNSSDIHAAKILDTATSMLRVALDAKNSKIDRKLRTLDQQLKKLRLDQQAARQDDEQNGRNQEFDRDQLLRLLNEQESK